MHTIEKALEALKAGQFVIVADDFDRENEGDLIIAADKVTPQALAFMVRHTTGIICMPMLGEQLDALKLPLMVNENTESYRTAFTVSVDGQNTTTGVSAIDRCNTIKALNSPTAVPSDFRRPGHIFPLRYKEGGVLKRAGHTEAAVDLCRMAGMSSAGVLSEIVNDDGSMARIADLKEFAQKHNLCLISVADIVRYRRSHEKLVTCVSKARLPTAQGDFTAYVYESTLDHIQHVALVKGDVRGKSNVLVRVHSECLTGDVFASQRCDCGTQLSCAMELIEKEGVGVVIYLRGHEGRGIGLGHKLRAYHIQDHEGKDTVDANIALGFPVDSREYGIGAQILVDLGVTTLRLLTNNPAKYTGLSGYDLEVVERIPLNPPSHVESRSYLLTKKNKMGHLIDV